MAWFGDDPNSAYPTAPTAPTRPAAPARPAPPGAPGTGYTHTPAEWAAFLARHPKFKMRPSKPAPPRKVLAAALGPPPPPSGAGYSSAASSYTPPASSGGGFQQAVQTAATAVKVAQGADQAISTAQDAASAVSDLVNGDEVENDGIEKTEMQAYLLNAGVAGTGNLMIGCDVGFEDNYYSGYNEGGAWIFGASHPRRPAPPPRKPAPPLRRPAPPLHRPAPPVHRPAAPLHRPHAPGHAPAAPAGTQRWFEGHRVPHPPPGVHGELDGDVNGANDPHDDPHAEAGENDDYLDQFIPEMEPYELSDLELDIELGGMTMASSVPDRDEFYDDDLNQLACAVKG